MNDSNKVTLERVYFVAKIAISFLILYILVRKIDFAQAIAQMFKLSFLVILLLIITTIIKFYTQYKNWEWNLRVNPSFNAKSANVLKNHMIGLALRLVVPGGYAAFAKVFYISNSSKKATFTSALLERFFQGWIILFFASIALLFFPNKVSHLVWFFLLVVILLSPFALRYVFRLRILKNISEFSVNYSELLVRVLCSQVFYELVTFFQYYLLISHYVGLSFWNTSIAVSLILVSNLIPITYSGLGLRETASVMIFQHYHVPAEIAVSSSLLIFIYNAILPALPGFYFLYKGKKQA